MLPVLALSSVVDTCTWQALVRACRRRGGTDDKGKSQEGDVSFTTTFLWCRR
jgi:hypothetical protein